LEGELRDVKRESQTVKRRLEEKEEEEQNKKRCGEYYFVDARADLARNTAGIRVTI
jgi:hypothetical protein